MEVALKASFIKEVLIKKNKSQNWFAKRIGVSSGYMSQLFNDIRHPSPRLRIKILNALKLKEENFDDVFEIKRDDH